MALPTNPLEPKIAIFRVLIVMNYVEGYLLCGETRFRRLTFHLR
jgi:hypothetical protein